MYVVDDRDHYGANWAVTSEKTRDTLTEAVALARSKAALSGRNFYVHRYSETQGRWILEKEVRAQ
jgi:hypothetical protein